MPGARAPRTVRAVFRSLRPYQIVVDAAIAVAFATVALPIEVLLAGSDPHPVPGAFAALLFALCLAARRLSPALALAGAWAAAIVQMLFFVGPRPSDLAIFAILYVTAAYGSRLVYWLGFASAALGAVVITVYLFGAPGLFSFGQITTAIAVLVAALFALMLAWVSGALVRMAVHAEQGRRAQAIAEAETAAEHERLRIARDMHDIVAHSLAVVIAQADGARYAAASDGAATAAALATISGTARAALADVRLLLTRLRHAEGTGPQPTLADVEALYAQVRAAGVELVVEVDPVPPGEPPAAVQLAVFRILQEALTNALRHGAAAPVGVRLSWLPDRVHLVVQNALRAGAPPQTGGHGLIGMRERAQLVGGRVDAGALGSAFVVTATLPVGGAV